MDPADGPGGGAVPQYTPDGLWYWTGRSWIPAGAVLAARPPSNDAYRRSTAALDPRPEAARRRLGRFAATAGLLIALILITTAGSASAWRGASPALGAQAAEQVLEGPFAGGLRDARVRIVTHDGSSPDEQSEGVMVFSPSRALRLQVRTEGDPVPVQETIDVHGVTYTRTRDPARMSTLASAWTADDASSPALRGTGWADYATPAQLSIAALETVGRDRAWHLTASGGFNWWIRVGDRHPLKIVRHVGLTTVTYLFDRFDSGATVHPPPDSQVSTQLVNGRAGEVLHAPWAHMRVTQLKEVDRPFGYLPALGVRKFVAYAVFVNTSDVATAIQGTPTATDASGRYFDWERDTRGQTPSGRIVVGPGQSAAGWLTLSVPSGTAGLTVRILANSYESSMQSSLFSIRLSN
jgi:hypothetical protein